MPTRMREGVYEVPTTSNQTQSDTFAIRCGLRLVVRPLADSVVGGAAFPNLASDMVTLVCRRWQKVREVEPASAK